MSNPGHFGSPERKGMTYEGRGKRGKNKRTLILDALHDEVRCEEDLPFDTPEEAEAAFLRLLVRRSLNVADRSSAMLAKEVLDRLCPTDKATLPTYQIEFDPEGSPAEKIKQINAAVASGAVPPDVGNIMVNMITAEVKVVEVTEMAARMERLERMLAELDKE